MPSALVRIRSIGVGGQAGHEPAQEVVDRLVPQRLERERGVVADVRTPTRMPLRDLGTRQRHDVDGIRARPVEQVLDELEERGIGPVDVLEHHDYRVLLGHPLEEQTPRREEILAVRRDAVRQPEEMLEPGLDERPLFRIDHDLGEDGGKLRERLVRRFVLGDACAHPDHLRERPVGDAVSIGETAPSVPPRRFQDAVEVLLELPGKPRLPHAGHRDDGDQVRAALVGGRVEELLGQAELALASDERRLEACGATPTFPCGDDAERTPQRHRLALPLQCMLAGTHVRDCCFGRALRGVSDKHAPGLRLGLDARSGVDEIAGDHALPFGPDRDGSLPGEHPGASAQCRIEVGDTGDEVERSADGALGVVLLRDGCAPDGHDRVPDELLDRAAVALDGRAGLLEVAGEQLPGVLRVASLGGGRESDEVGEQDGHEAALGCRSCSRRRRGSRCCRRRERRPALAAEFHTGGIPRPAQWAAAASDDPHSPQNFRPASFA